MRPFILFFAIIGCSVAFDLDCRFQMNTFSWIDGSFYTCRRDNITAATHMEDRYVEDVIGTHMSGKTNDDVVGVHIRGDRMYYFPWKFQNYFKHLRIIAVEYTKLVELRARDMMPYTELEYLFVSYNMIEVLEKDLFKYNTNLKGVSIEYNRLRFVHASIFDHLINSLKFMQMKQAGCVDMRQDGNIQTGISTLREKCSSYDNFVPILTDIYYAQRRRAIV